MITVKYFPCQFEDRCYEFKSPNHAVHTVLLHLVRKYPEIREDSPQISIRVNGEKISPFAWSCTELRDGDRVLIIQEVGFELILSAIGGIFGTATTVAAGATAVGWAGAATLATILDVALVVASLAYSIYSMCNKPDAQHAKGADSPTYGWDGIQTNMQQGGPVTAVYGEHPIPGNVIGGK